MKKVVLLMALIFVAFFGCTKDSEQSDLQDESNFTTKAHKVDVCHQKGNGDWKVINVSQNALPAHLAHGDVALIDEDGDGFVAEENECVPGGDCDDNNPTTFPGAEEICGDGIDNNCDGQIDEDCCPCFTLEEVLATDNQRYFDTMDGSFCNFDGAGFNTNGFLYGVSYDRFLCVSPDGMTNNPITAEERASCQAIIQQAIAELDLPENCTGMTPVMQSNEKSQNSNPFLNN